ncbi:MAG: helix-turn-helix domain-containing protein [bacterium]
MQAKLSQKEKVKKILLQNGEVSRNICIRELYITRLSAIIQDLEEEGWQFNPEVVRTEHGKDFVYYLTKTPFKKVEYYVPLLKKVITQYVKK